MKTKGKKRERSLTRKKKELARDGSTNGEAVPVAIIVVEDAAALAVAGCNMLLFCARCYNRDNSCYNRGNSRGLEDAVNLAEGERLHAVVPWSLLKRWGNMLKEFQLFNMKWLYVVEMTELSLPSGLSAAISEYIGFMAIAEEAKIEELIKTDAQFSAKVVVSGESVGEIALHFYERHK
ncbi:hypothetical protein PIB30_047207 [Stylosanthes scabra]|uniref:Uncharacterized protein n=1 Tax=Stylosanthes scabra TaxID=79078 RepID=A0ABU6TGE3_9FABA|nr:hypothetical protein [Stylosanthes scabra]